MRSRSLAVSKKIALFYLNNRDKIETADTIDERDTELTRVRSREAKLTVKVEIAATAFSSAGTLCSIMTAVHCGHPMARELHDEAKRRGLIVAPQPRTKKCATPKATKPAEPLPASTSSLTLSRSS